MTVVVFEFGDVLVDDVESIKPIETLEKQSNLDRFGSNANGPQMFVRKKRQVKRKDWRHVRLGLRKHLPQVADEVFKAERRGAWGHATNPWPETKESGNPDPNPVRAVRTSSFLFLLIDCNLCIARLTRSVQWHV